MNVYQITHHSENDPRISLSRDSFRLLAQYGIKRALILFISESSLNYRLSLVTIDLKWEEGRRVKKEYSNPRRYSFFLGPETKTHTPETYLIKKGRIKDFEDLKNRFSIEVVNKDFYTQIAILFTKLAGGKRTIGRTKYDEKGSLQLPSTFDDTIKKEFSVRLIGRLIFCWFLKKKSSDKGSPLLSEELLSSNSVTQSSNFYHNVLEPLFFETLNTPIKQRKKEYQIPLWSQIPFLNGGLFTPEYHDYYQVDQLGISKYINILKVPNNWLKELFDIFEIYNFTIDENTPVDIELSIEPEMLGRIFENLLAEINPETGNSARKSTGSYYTPRTIVEYMVDESLKQYLLSKTNLDENKISSLLAYEEEEVSLSEPEKDVVLNALDVIKIIDPACGSGAFPMGILQKMLLILQKIDPESEKWLLKKLSKIDNNIVKKEITTKLQNANWNYVHKLGIIQSSIYGVDIQPIAVDISKLRFFLSLIVDEKIDDLKNNRGIEPLPNLEFKFVCGNSLIGLPGKNSQTELFEAVDNITELKKLREEYLRCYGDEKISIEKKFQEIQSRMFLRSLKWGGKDSQTVKLSQWNPFSGEASGWFDSDWMFGVRDGFDIIITNPPYIGEKGHKEMFRKIRRTNLGKYYQRNMDLFYFFFHIALDIGRKNANIAFITTNYYSTATGAKKLRQAFKYRTTIKNLINFNELKIFKSAQGQHNMVTILQESQNLNAIARTVITQRDGYTNSEILQKILDGNDTKTRYYKISQNDLYEGEELYIRLNKNKVTKILSNISGKSKPLKKFCDVYKGIETGKNTAFVFNDLPAFYSRLTKEERSLIVPFYKNSDIVHYHHKKNTKYLLYFPNGIVIENFPNISEYLKSHKKELLTRAHIKRSSRPWYTLLWPRDPKLFLPGPKIVTSYRPKINSFCYIEDLFYSGTDTYYIVNPKKYSLKFIVGILNSKLSLIWLKNKGKIKGNIIEMTGDTIEQILIPRIETTTNRNRHEIELLVDKILTITKDDDYLTNPEKQTKVKELEKQIDQMVYKLYDLTDDEIKIVENFENKK